MEKCLSNRLDKRHLRGLRERKRQTDPLPQPRGSTVAQTG